MRDLPRALGVSVRPFAWLRDYDAGSFRGDLVAGITLAAYVLPVALAYASLAGLPPQAGLYSCTVAGVAFAPFCSSRRTAIATTSAISLLLGATLGPMAAGDPVRHASLAAATALYVALICLIARALRAGGVVQFMSDVVLTGFKAGAALTIAATQLPKLFGVSGGGGSFAERVAVIAQQLPEVHLASFAIGATAIAALVLGGRWFPKVPMSIVVVVAAVTGMSLVAGAGLGVRVLGEIPQGLPSPALPTFQWSDANTLLPLALACFLLATVETMAVGRVFAVRHGERIEANQDLAAIGFANLAAGLFQGYPVSGGMSQSAVAENAGAKTPATLLVASSILGIVALFLSGLLRDLPEPVLAAIVLVAVSGLVDVRGLARVRRFGAQDFAISCLAMIGVLASGLLRGVLLASVFSLILLIRRASNPPVAVLGRARGSGRFGDVDRDPDYEELPGVLVARIAGAIVYFNAEAIRDRIVDLVRAREPGLRVVVVALGTTPIVDLAGSDMLAGLHDEMVRRGIRLELAEAHGPVRDALEAAGVVERFGDLRPRSTLEEVVAAAILPPSFEPPARGGRGAAAANVARR
jgi:sulfate permease, SulP family